MLRLVGGNLNYSSWTLRAWLALRMTGADFKFHDVQLLTKPGWKERILAFSGAGLVPILIDGPLSIHESLAIGEYLHELHPEAGLWPEDRALRARGRALCCELSSSFHCLRRSLPVNLRAKTSKLVSDERVEADIARICDIWEASLLGTGGPYLLGKTPTLVDCFFAPTASRFQTYTVSLPQTAQQYADTVLSLPLLAEVQKKALSEPAIQVFDEKL